MRPWYNLAYAHSYGEPNSSMNIFMTLYSQCLSKTISSFGYDAGISGGFGYARILNDVVSIYLLVLTVYCVVVNTFTVRITLNYHTSSPFLNATTVLSSYSCGSSRFWSGYSATRITKTTRHLPIYNHQYLSALYSYSDLRPKFY